jgi:hypothetical protein
MVSVSLHAHASNHWVNGMLTPRHKMPGQKPCGVTAGPSPEVPDLNGATALQATDSLEAPSSPTIFVAMGERGGKTSRDYIAECDADTSATLPTAEEEGAALERFNEITAKLQEDEASFLAKIPSFNSMIGYYSGIVKPEAR